MRVAAGLIIVLCTGALAQTRAAEPQAPLSPPQSTAAPAEQQSATAGDHGTATAPAAPATSVATTPAANTPAATTTPAAANSAGKVELSREEHDLISRGYKLEIRHGERYFCRRESELGSHFDVKTCNTAESIEAHRANSVETVREMQANKPEINK